MPRAALLSSLWLFGFLAVAFGLFPATSAQSDGGGGPPAPGWACQDGDDNDQDSAVDWPNDSNCESPADNDESGTPGCGDGLDNDGDGLTDAPVDPGCTDAADGGEIDPPAKSAWIEAEPGPGLSAITVRWALVAGATAYILWSDDGQRNNPNNHRSVGIDLETGPCCGEWERGDGYISYYVTGLPNPGVIEFPMATVAPAPTQYYEVQAVNEGGEGELSDRVSTTPFLACDTFFGAICVGLHPVAWLGTLRVHTPADTEPAVHVGFADGKLRVEAANTYVEQRLLTVLIEDQSDPLVVLDGQEVGPVTLRYASGRPDSLFGEVPLTLSATSDPERAAPDVDLFSGRFWVYENQRKVSDVPVVFALFGPCGDTYDGQDDLAGGWVEDPSSCHQSPASGAVLVYVALLAGVLVVYHVRRRT